MLLYTRNVCIFQYVVAIRIFHRGSEYEDIYLCAARAQIHYICMEVECISNFFVPFFISFLTSCTFLLRGCTPCVAEKLATAADLLSNERFIKITVT